MNTYLISNGEYSDYYILAILQSEKTKEEHEKICKEFVKLYNEINKNMPVIGKRLDGIRPIPGDRSKYIKIYQEYWKEVSEWSKNKPKWLIDKFVEDKDYGLVTNIKYLEEALVEYLKSEHGYVLHPYDEINVSDLEG